MIGRHLGDPRLSAAAAAEVRAVITGTGALDECELMISRNLAEALAALEGAPIAPAAGQALSELAVAATARRG